MFLFVSGVTPAPSYPPARTAEFCTIQRASGAATPPATHKLTISESHDTTPTFVSRTTSAGGFMSCIYDRATLHLTLHLRQRLNGYPLSAWTDRSEKHARADKNLMAKRKRRPIGAYGHEPRWVKPRKAVPSGLGPVATGQTKHGVRLAPVPSPKQTARGPTIAVRAVAPGKMLICR